MRDLRRTLIALLFIPIVGLAAGMIVTDEWPLILALILGWMSLAGVLMRWNQELRSHDRKVWRKYENALGLDLTRRQREEAERFYEMAERLREKNLSELEIFDALRSERHDAERRP